MEPILRAMSQTSLGPMTVLQWTEVMLAALAAVASSGWMEKLELAFLQRLASRNRSGLVEGLSQLLRGPARVLSALVVFRALLSPFNLPLTAEDFLQKIFGVAFIIAVGWTLLRAGLALIHAYERQREQKSESPAEVAAIRTQLRLAERMASVVVFAFTGALALLQFDVVRNLGMSVLASAGVAGVVVGFAAQRSLATLLAGIQLSITQPIRIGDAVELQKELGFVEDIRLSHVVIRLWDGRRLIVPTSRFVEEPIVNLTKGAENLLGSIEWRVDFSIPVHQVREAFEQIVANEPRWDGKVKAIEVTDVGDKTVTLRGLVSARDPSDLWPLRVAVREKLVEWLRQRDGSNTSPRERAIAAVRPQNGSVVATRAASPGDRKGAGPNISLSGARGA